MNSLHATTCSPCCLAQAPLQPRRQWLQPHPSHNSRGTVFGCRAKVAQRSEPAIDVDRADRGAEASTSSIPAGVQRSNSSGRLALPSAEACGSTLLLLGGLAALLHTDAALAADTDLSQHHYAANAVFGDIAAGGEEDFWGNVGSYARFFITVMLGTANIVTKPFRDAAKKPEQAIFVGIGAVLLFAFMAFTVKLMLGLSDDQNFEYLTRGV